jgi:hypothetical protein
VDCNNDWTTRRVRISLQHAGREQQLELNRSAQGVWYAGETRLQEVEGLADIDLAISPCTNTLPVRRNALEVGATVSVTAAWVAFPGLTVSPLAQSYTRTGPNQYHYESNAGAFQSELEVDDFGLIVRYGDWWQRMAQY